MTDKSTKFELEVNQLIADAETQLRGQKKLSLAEVQNLCRELSDIEKTVDHLEEQLSIQKEEYKELAEKYIPEAFNDLGISSLSLKDGTTINLQEIIAATINDENRAAAHGWLRDNGFGDIIKNEVVVSFGKDQDELAHCFALNATGCGGLVSKQEKVHPSTLKAFVKERLRSGEPFPADTFKLFVGVAARVNKKVTK